MTGPGKAIVGFEGWFPAAPPKKGLLQWKPCSSAMEIARAWCAGGVPAPPAEMMAALEQHELTRGFAAADVVVEHVTLLDDVPPTRGEHRNHDLVVVGASPAGRVLVGVEAKAGEKFGDPAGEYYEKMHKNPKSRVPRRIALLIEALTGESVDFAHRALDHPLAQCGYQLLTASVGTVIEAQRRGCDYALMLVHEFECVPPTPKQKTGLPHSARDLNAFVTALTGGPLHDGSITGPLDTHPTAFVTGEIPLLIGKCRTVVTHPRDQAA